MSLIAYVIKRAIERSLSLSNMSLRVPKSKLYNPSTVAAAFASMDGFSMDSRHAGARAMLRYKRHEGDYLDMRTKGGLHPLYTEICGRGSQTNFGFQETDKLVKDTLCDTFDSVSALTKTTIFS